MIFKSNILRYIAIACSALIILLYNSGIWTGSTFDYTIFTLAMVLIGIPHGAVDHIIDKKMYGKNHELIFYITYLSSIFLMASLWFVYKPLGFIVFLLITIYHFGITDVQKLESISDSKRLAAGITRGVFIISMLLLANPQESFDVISNILATQIRVPDLIVNYSSLSVFGMLFIFSLVMIHLFDYDVKNKEVQNYFIDSILLTIIFLSTSNIIGFSIYFALWHSLKHLEEFFEASKEIGVLTRIKSFYKQALPFSLISYFGILLLFGVFVYFNLQQNLLSISLIVVSALTLPHVFVVEKFYVSKRQN